jgi:hypothetical protein
MPAAAPGKKKSARHIEYLAFKIKQLHKPLQHAAVFHSLAPRRSRPPAKTGPYCSF